MEAAVQIGTAELWLIIRRHVEAQGYQLVEPTSRNMTSPLRIIGEVDGTTVEPEKLTAFVRVQDRAVPPYMPGDYRDHVPATLADDIERYGPAVLVWDDGKQRPAVVSSIWFNSARHVVRLDWTDVTEGATTYTYEQLREQAIWQATKEPIGIRLSATNSRRANQ